MPHSTSHSHRVRLPLEAAKKMLEENVIACNALVAHIDGCQVCIQADDLCPAAQPLADVYRTARMRSRLYLGEDVNIENAGRDSLLS
jgi:hypothetical protein